MLGAVVGAAAAVGLTAVFLAFRDDVTSAAPAVALVLPVVAAGLLGGLGAAALVAVVGAVAFNLAFLPPYWTLKIAAVEDLIALAVFLVVAVALGALVLLEEDRRRAAEQQAAEQAALLAELERVSAERERLAAEAARAAMLERVDEQRAALLRSVSHDLRTPLATIRAVATDLRDGADYDRDVERELLGTVSDEAERLDRLVGNLLSLSRIEAGALRPDRQAVDVEELVADVAHRLRRLFRQARLEVDAADDLPLVDGDYSQLDQVVSNLLENAARHAPPSSTVRVAVTAAGGRVRLRVADEGPGVPAGDRDRIFDPFQRGAGGGSSGVGLAICKAIVEAHGGAVAVGAAPGGGAEFTLDLPARRG